MDCHALAIIHLPSFGGISRMPWWLRSSSTISWFEIASLIKSFADFPMIGIVDVFCVRLFQLCGLLVQSSTGVMMCTTVTACYHLVASSSWWHAWVGQQWQATVVWQPIRLSHRHTALISVSESVQVSIGIIQRLHMRFFNGICKSTHRCKMQWDGMCSFWACWSIFNECLTHYCDWFFSW